MAEASPPRGKMRFRRNAISFPGNLHLVLVLRPTSLIQRTFTDFGFRFSQEDFMLKLPVIMLSSVSDLLTYIDGKQLTPELGGTLQYCHSEWILFRNAIENFAVTVKEVAQMLQAFGTELAETELPNDMPSIEKILALHTERYHVLKNDITAVTKEGKILLTTMEVPNTSETFSSSLACQPYICDNWKTINKLLAQVRDMETAFDGFWEKYQLKTEQYLQLWKFEHDFQEVVARVEFLLNQQGDLSHVLGNLAQVRQKVKKIQMLDEKAQELFLKAHFLIVHGHKLASSHHYALDLICRRCNELRYVSDVLVNETRGKRIQLSRTFKMHKLLQQADHCCDEGACLLVNQEADGTQSEEDGQKALQDLENFLQVALPFINYDAETLEYEFDVLLSPELKVQLEIVQLKLENIRSLFENQHGGFKTLKGNPEFAVSTSQSVVEPRTLLSPKHVRKSWRLSQSNMNIEEVQGCQEQRNSDDASNLNNDERLDILQTYILNELIQTERTYVQELFSVLLGYRAEMDNPQMFDLMPSVLRNKKDVLFGNMAEIYEFHNNIFMGSLETCFDAPERVGPCFLERKHDFQMYAKYCQNKPRSEKIWRKYSECAFFRECQRKLKHRLGLDSYLLKPVQRITKYQLLLKELLKCTQGHEGSTMLKEALDTMLELLKSVNDSMHVTAINGYSGNLNELGKMILQGGFSVWIGHRKGAPKMKDFARFKSMQRHIFLYEKAVMFCKRRVESGVDCDKYPSYSFKHCLKMEEVGITEFVKGDSRKFEIWYHEKEEIYIVQAPNIDVKMLWVKELRNLLLKTKQLILANTKKQQDLVTGKDQVSPRQNFEKQEEASVKIEEAELEQASAVVDISKRVVPIQAEARRVCTERPPPTDDPAVPAESSRPYHYHASHGNEEPSTPVTGPEKRVGSHRVYL